VVSSVVWPHSCAHSARGTGFCAVRRRLPDACTGRKVKSVPDVVHEAVHWSLAIVVNNQGGFWFSLVLHISSASSPSLCVLPDSSTESEEATEVGQVAVVALMINGNATTRSTASVT